MKNHLVLATLLLAACGTQAAAEGPASDAAIIAMAKPEVQFRNLLAGSLFSTESMSRAAYALGIAKTCELVKPAFDAAIAKGLPDWQANLVGAYRDNVPEDILARAAADPATISTFIDPFGERIGTQMQRDSQGLLAEALAQALAPAADAAANVDIKAIDGPARRAELQKALADGSASCGLRPTRTETR